MTDEPPSRDELAADIEDLRERNTRTAKQIREATQPLREAKEEAEAERDQLAQRVAKLESIVTDLQQQVDSFIGLAEDEQTTHKKRVTDIRNALKRRAQARSGDGAGKAAMDRIEIQNTLNDLGHEGEFADAQLIRIIDHGAREPGFDVVEDYVNENGNEVKALRVNLGKLAVSAPTNDVSSVETAATDGGTQIDGGDDNSG